ncbi:hypothetical protein MSPP1_000479 [Malassezia sp. CBS 17886]|nr:hypothetical protein MSPP1_000479 [Malassezia sp. CBS 17886]
MRADADDDVRTYARARREGAPRTRAEREPRDPVLANAEAQGRAARAQHRRSRSSYDDTDFVDAPEWEPARPRRARGEGARMRPPPERVAPARRPTRRVREEAAPAAAVAAGEPRGTTPRGTTPRGTTPRDTTPRGTALHGAAPYGATPRSSLPATPGVHTPRERAADDITMSAQEQPRSNRRRRLKPVPQGQVNQMHQGRVFPLTGIDNLALLMEDETYHPACFSMYLFRSTLDYRTVRDFFEVLAQLYPKYRYVVDFQPYSAQKRDRQKKKEQEALAQATPEARAAHQREVQEAARVGRLPFYGGPKTTYSKSLKSGSLMRPAQWRIDDDFHVSENIHVVACAGGGTDEELYNLAGRFLGRHFDYSKPVWEALLVQGVNTRNGAKSALMIKIHHAFSDGQGMIQSYHAALTAMHRDVGIKQVQQWVDTSNKNKKTGRSRSEVRDNIRTVCATISHAMYTFSELYFRKRNSFVYRNPRQKRASQRLYWESDGVSMQEIKHIREAFSTETQHLTLNDIAVAILARAMGLAADRLAAGAKSDRRAAIFVPISDRPQGNWDLHNYTSGAIAWLKFPTDTASAPDQLASVHKEMRRLKKSYLPKIWYNMFNFFCKARVFFLPNYPLYRQFFYRAFSEYHVATNVPGPTEPVWFGKHEAFSYHVLPPSSPGKATMAIGMISYASDFSIAISCDDVPEFKDLPRVLCETFQIAAQAMIDEAHEKIGVV